MGQITQPVFTILGAAAGFAAGGPASVKWGALAGANIGSNAYPPPAVEPAITSPEEASQQHAPMPDDAS